jgi:hypothetical protein
MTASYTIYERPVIDLTVVTVERKPFVAVGAIVDIVEKIPDVGENSTGSPIDYVVAARW